MKTDEQIWGTSHPVDVEGFAERLSSIGFTQDELSKYSIKGGPAKFRIPQIAKLANMPARLCDAIDGLVKYANYNSGNLDQDASNKVSAPAQKELETVHQADFIAPDPNKTSVANTVASGQGADQSQKALEKSANTRDIDMDKRVLAVLRKLAADHTPGSAPIAVPTNRTVPENPDKAIGRVSRKDVERYLFNHAGYSDSKNTENLDKLNNFRQRERLRVAAKRAPELYHKLKEKYSGGYSASRGLPPAVMSWVPGGYNKLYHEGKYTSMDTRGDYFQPAVSDYDPRQSDFVTGRRDHSILAVRPDGDAEFHEGFHMATTPLIMAGDSRRHTDSMGLRRFGQRLREFGVPGDKIGNELDINRAIKTVEYWDKLNNGSATANDQRNARPFFDPIHSKTSDPERARANAGIKFSLHKEFGDLAFTPDDAINIMLKNGKITLHDEPSGGFRLTGEGRRWRTPANDNGVDAGGEYSQRNEIDRFVREYNAVQSARKYIEQSKQHPENVDPEKLKRAQEFVEQFTDDYNIADMNKGRVSGRVNPYLSIRRTALENG